MKWLVILFVIWVIAVSIYESSQKAKLSELGLQIQEMTYLFYSDALSDGVIQINEEIPTSVQIKLLQYQADVLKSCFLCPLYQEKARKLKSGDEENE